MVDFFKILVSVEKYVCVEEVYKVHGPPSNPVTKEQSLAQKFLSRREDKGKGRQGSQSPP